MNKKALLVMCVVCVVGCCGAISFAKNREENVEANWKKNAENAGATTINQAKVEKIQKKDAENESTLSGKKSDFTKSKITDEIYQRIKGKSYKKNCTVPLSDLRYLRLLYYGFDKKTHEGEMIVNKKIADDVIDIFYQLYRHKYQIERIELIDKYDADDDRSMAANNTSSFNYRTVKGTKRVSKHGYGLAIDVNTKYNPYVHQMNGVWVCDPKNGKKYQNRSKKFAHKITHEDLCYKLFHKKGFTWGGDWHSCKDYQHFEIDK